MDKSKPTLPVDMGFGSVSTFVEKENVPWRDCRVKSSREIEIESNMEEDNHVVDTAEIPSPVRMPPRPSLFTKFKNRFETVKVLLSSDVTGRRPSAPRRLWLRALFGRPPPNLTGSLCASRDIPFHFLYFHTTYALIVLHY